MTTSLTLRSVKGSALTFTEVDDNFSNLKTTADGAKTTADAAAVAGGVTSSGLTMATGKLLGRTSASTGAIQEITAGAGLALSSGQLEVDFTGYLTSTAAASAYQPLDGDLTAIAAISGTSGLLKKTAADTWSLDTSTYLTTTDAASTYQPKDADLTAIAGLSGTSGILTKTAADTWSLDTTSYQPLDGDLTAIAAISTNGVLTRTGSNTWAVVTAPSGTIVGTSDTQTLTNKTLTAPVISTISNTGTLTLPTSTDTLVGRATTDTLTNKTLTSPELGGSPYVNGSYRSNIVAVSALDIDCSAGNYFTKTINANSTFTFSNVPSSRAYSFTLELTHTSGTVTWPTEVKWPENTGPSLTSGNTHLFVFVTDDGGTRWRGAVLANYVN